jgi:hypothetical protein
MQKQFILFIASLVISLSFAGCKKDSVAVKTNTELISQSSWKFSGATVSGIDVSSFIQVCQKDNVLTFAASGSGSVDEGTTKCNVGDPQTQSFTWNFASNETVLHVSTVFFTGGSSDFTLVSLTAAQLVLSQNVTISGSSQNAVVTFIH